MIVGHSRRARGRRVVESERTIGGPAIREVTEDQLLDYLLEELRASCREVKSLKSEV